MSADQPLVGIVMGSDSDWPVMAQAAAALDDFGLPWTADVISAHRMPEATLAWGRQAHRRGLKVIIAGAGGAAHLPGVLAAVSPLPVIGVPVALPVLDGLDSLLSIVQMPSGVPVATVGVGNARNAGLLAARILATGDDDLLAAYQDFQAVQAEQALAKGEAVRSRRPDPAAPGPTRPTSRPGQPADPANQPDPAAHGPKRPTTRPGP